MATETESKVKTKPDVEMDLAGAPCFIERQFPVAKVSAESFREREAKQGQLLTSLGKWWGRKPLVLTRAVILGCLLPATDDAKTDLENFLLLMEMDSQGLWDRRKSRCPLPAKLVFASISQNEREQFFTPSSTALKPKYVKGFKAKTKEALHRRIFDALPFSKKLEFTDRVELRDGPSRRVWKDVNRHLASNAKSLSDLVLVLGQKRFGRQPVVGDAFCGSGSIPYEAAHIGCKAVASDLNPVAALLSWGTANIIGGGEQAVGEVNLAINQVVADVKRTLEEHELETNELGWRADAFLYCVEVTDPESGWRIPLLPSCVLGKKTKTIVKLIPQSATKSYELKIVSGVSNKELADAESHTTVSDYRLVPPGDYQSTPIESLSQQMRHWEKSDFHTRKDDIFQDRLFCIRWIEDYFEFDEDGVISELTIAEANALPTFQSLVDEGLLQPKSRRHYRSVTSQDQKREEQACGLLAENFADWQSKGYGFAKACISGAHLFG